MGLEPRQQYGLGSFVKKTVKGVTGAVKNIAKSDLGKAALIGGLGMIPFGASGASMFSRLGSAASGIFSGGFPSIPGLETASKFLGGEKTLGKTLGVMAGGSLLGGLLAKAEAGDEEAVAATRDVNSLRSYLDSGYRNLGYPEDEIPALVEQGVSEYSSSQGGYATGGRVGAMYGGRIGFDNGGFEPFKYTSKIPRVFKEDPFGSDSLGQILNMSYTVRAPLIDIIRTVAKTATEATKLAAAAVKLGYDVTEPVREVVGDVAGGIYDIAKKSVQESGDVSRLIQPTYYLERFGPEKNLTDDETRLKRLKRSIGRDDRDLIKTIENRIFEYDDAGMNQNEEDKKVSNKIQAKIDERNFGFADGGRIGYAFGNKPEQNAMAAAGIEGLPLNQNSAGVTELDLRETGGFIPPVGVKEKADDIPAMLANNEFVFTADAVRGMGDGNVNKGAQRMYDMMKKLEKGGRV